MPRRPARKAPKGMPKEMAKALGLKGRAHPSKAPVRERTHNPLQYLLERASQGRGVTLPPNETLVVAQALMGSREELKRVIGQLSALQAERTKMVELWTEGYLDDLTVDDDEAVYSQSNYAALRNMLLDADDELGEDGHFIEPEDDEEDV